MRKKAFLIPILTLITAIALYGAIAWAGSAQPESKDILDQANELRAAQKFSEAEKLYNQVKAENPGLDKALEAQKQLIQLAIDQRDQKKADASFNQMVTDYAKNAGLDKAVYEIGKDYQYSIWNTAKANQTHKYNMEHFPNTKYGMLSNIEIFRSYLRDKKELADSEVDKWLNMYKGQPDQAMGIYLLARAYAGNNKPEKALQLFKYAIDNHPTHVYGLLSQVRYETTNKDYEAADKAADNLIAASEDNEDVKENIRDLADFYRDKKEYARAIHFYKAEIENWPDYDEPTTPYREAIYCYINMKDIANADTLIGQMQTNLAKDPKLASTNFDIGNYFLNTAKDNANALKVHKYNAEHYTNVMEAMWSQAALVWYYVRHNDQANADIEYAKLIDVYKGQETLPKEIFQIADIYRNEKKNYEKALSLYKYQLENWPNYGEPTDTYRKLACTYIAMKDITNADSIIGQMQEKFAKNPKLPRANFDIGNYFLNDANDPVNALKIHKHNADNYSNIMEAMWSQAALVWYYVRHDDQANAEIEYAKLLDVYKSQATLPKEIFQIGDIYREKKNYDKALSLYKYQLEKWPDYGQPIDIYRKMACTYIDMNDIKNADAVIADIQTKFAKNSNLARANFDIGNYFLNDANDPVNALKMHEYNANHYTSVMEAMWSQAALVWYYVRAKDNSKADEAYAKLLSTFNNQNTLAKEVFQIADIYTEVGNYVKAIELAEYTMEKWPESEYKLDAQKSIVKAQFESGDFAAAEDSLGKLIANSKENSDLARILFDFGDQYYEKARGSRVNNQPNPDDKNYQKTLVIWRKTYETLPLSSYTKDAWFFSGACYSRELRQPEKAIPYYERVVAEWPDYQYLWSAQIMIADCYEKLLNRNLIVADIAEPKIEKACDAFIKNHPENKWYSYACLKTSDIKIKKSEFAQAANILEQLIENSSQQDDKWLSALDKLSIVYKKMGDDGKAQEIINIHHEIAGQIFTPVTEIQINYEKMKGVEK